MSFFIKLILRLSSHFSINEIIIKLAYLVLGREGVSNLNSNKVQTVVIVMSCIVVLCVMCIFGRESYSSIPSLQL
jgi:hypothetical protein